MGLREIEVLGNVDNDDMWDLQHRERQTFNSTNYKKKCKKQDTYAEKEGFLQLFIGYCIIFFCNHHILSTYYNFLFLLFKIREDDKIEQI